MGDKRIDIRGPFVENFEAVVNGKPLRNTFYLGLGDAIKNKLQACLDAKEGTPIEKAAHMFADVLHPYPVYVFKQMHAATLVEK